MANKNTVDLLETRTNKVHKGVPEKIAQIMLDQEKGIKADRKRWKLIQAKPKADPKAKPKVEPKV